jgi:type IV secretion system protein VirB10
MMALSPAGSILRAQDGSTKTERQSLAPRQQQADGVTVEPGTRIPLTLIKTVDSKHSEMGDRVYLQTAFPVVENGRIAIPPGSYVIGTLTHVKRPGRVKGRGELFLRFDSLTLPNGVVRDFRARVSGLDGRGDEELDRAEGKVRSSGNKAGDMRTIGETAAAGASVGVIAGTKTGAYGTGAAAGAAAGAVVGLMGVLLSRGPDAVLSQGSTIEMVVDRPLTFDPSELNFQSVQPTHVPDGGGPVKKKDTSIRPRFPI